MLGSLYFYLGNRSVDRIENKSIIRTIQKRYFQNKLQLSNGSKSLAALFLFKAPVKMFTSSKALSAREFSRVDPCCPVSNNNTNKALLGVAATNKKPPTITAGGLLIVVVYLLRNDVLSSTLPLTLLASMTAPFNPLLVIAQTTSAGLTVGLLVRYKAATPAT